MSFGYKVLNEDGSSCHGGNGKWHLPRGSRLGKWMPPIRNIALCERGYHICRDERDLLGWLRPAIWRVEWRGESIGADDKLVASEARLVSRVANWNDSIARQFACDCAEQAFKYARPQDLPTLKNTVAVARRYAVGHATADELKAAYAAASAANAAAYAAAYAAEKKWQAARLKKYLEGKLP